jgi:Ca-activated chloride channel homolog
MKPTLAKLLLTLASLTFLAGCASPLSTPDATADRQLRNQTARKTNAQTSERQEAYYGRHRPLQDKELAPNSISPDAAPEFDTLSENRFKSVRSSPVSTFSIDVDTGSYTIIRNTIASGQRPNPDAVRIEELINYFTYDYAPPTDGQPVRVHVDTGPAPWAKNHMIVKVGIKGKEIPASLRPASNLVFLIDVSGSMDQPNKLPLAIQSLKLLVSQLDARDRVTLITYAGSSGMALQPTSGADKAIILKALDNLKAGGSTNGGEGIRLAYQTALGHFIQKGNNRVILLTDGDFNVGITDRNDLTAFVNDQAGKGVYLSIFGFGMDNLKDGRLEELSRKGNGNYGYIDNLSEAKRAFAEQAAGTLYTIAKDVKVQVEFNPRHVAQYRLIGYENRLLSRQDFNNDKVDAGDMGSGHTVTALYEVITVGNQSSVPLGADARAQRTAQIDAQLETLKKQVREKRMDEDELAAFNQKVQALSAKRAKLQANTQTDDGEDIPPVDPLKYQEEARLTLNVEPGQSAEIMTVKVRYKAPDAPIQQGSSHLIETPVKVTAESLSRPISKDLMFACGIAEYAMVLRASPHLGSSNLRDALTLAKAGLGKDPMGHRAGFIQLIEKTRTLMPDFPQTALDVRKGL